MSILFTSKKIGSLELENRFIHSATYEGTAEENGKVSPALIKRYSVLAKGEIGLIIPGYLYVHPLGKAVKYQAGIHSDDMIPGLKKLADIVHSRGGKIAFQLVHAGRQTSRQVIGQNPAGPSSFGRDPKNFVRPYTMTDKQIRETMTSFKKAAERAAEAGADCVQLHGAHGYLINQFLSPYFNRRKDEWGGSDENRFRFLKEIVLMIKKVLPETLPLIIKLSTNDFTPGQGITPPLAAKYSKWLADLGINAVEVSAGSILYSFMNVCRGEVPAEEIAESLPAWRRPLVRFILNRKGGDYGNEEGYNLNAAEMIKPVMGDLPLCLVGGLRSKEKMEEILEKGFADFISLSRPFIREPLLVKRIKQGTINSASCKSCNRCLAAILHDIPVKCYYKGLPLKRPTS